MCVYIYIYIYIYIYSHLQSAYRAAHSTDTALLKIVDDILSIVESGSTVTLVGLDISAAFDTVSQRELLARLEHDFSIEKVALEWINSNLSKRTFFMRVGRSLSCSAGLQRRFLREQSPSNPRQISSLIVRYSAKITTCHQVVVNQRCRMLHRHVRKTINTWCYALHHAHVRDPYQRRGSLVR